MVFKSLVIGQNNLDLADSFRNQILVYFLRVRFLNDSFAVRFLMVPKSRWHRFVGSLLKL